MPRHPSPADDPAVRGVRAVAQRLATHWPSVGRLVAVALGAALSIGRLGPTRAAMITGLLVLVALSASLTHRRGPDVVRLATTEAVAAALVIGGTGGDSFAPYLLFPLISVGMAGGSLAGLLASGAASLTLALTNQLSRATGAPGADMRPLFWVPLMIGSALAGAASGKALRLTETSAEPAYADAHRLLSQLNVVARHLSLGLDPHTLAAALVEELQSLAAGARATVLVRSAAGRFVPVVGEEPNSLTESVVLDSWVAADLVRRGRSGTSVLALPVLMGERVVAVVVLSDSTGAPSLSTPSIAACRAAIARAGPRLASALLFDDVRRLATVDERHRLAREIHDGIAQDMASVGYQIDDIAGDAPPEVAERLHELREHLTTLVAELRLSIFDLRAGVDEALGLSHTLADYVQRVSRQAGLAVHVSTVESPHRLPLATEVELLRIVQEAVTNVRRHAGARNLWLSVHVDPPRAHIVVKDDGRGLSSPRPDSVGITGMKERATRIGASLTVRNREGARGTVVDIALEPNKLTTRSSVSITNTDERGVLARGLHGDPTALRAGAESS